MRSAGGGADRAAAAAQPAALDFAEPLADAERAIWSTKRAILEAEVGRLTATHRRLHADKEVVLDAVEAMLLSHERTKGDIQSAAAAADAKHAALMAKVKAQEDDCLMRKQRALAEAERLKARVTELVGLKEATQEAIVLEVERTEELEGDRIAARERVKAQERQLALLKEEEERMKDASYGLSGEVKDMVVAMEQLRQQQQKAELASMETEILRRELYSEREELKGSIRVYCRVKGQSQKTPAQGLTTTTTTTTTATAVAEGLEAEETPDGEGEGDDKVSGAVEGSPSATPREPIADDTLGFSSPVVSPLREEQRRRPGRDSVASNSITASLRRNKGTAAAAGSAKAVSTCSTRSAVGSCARGSGTDGGATATGPDWDPGDACPEEIFSFPDGAKARRRTAGGGKQKSNAAGEEEEKKGELDDDDDNDDDDEFAVPHTITVHQSRNNATSTGRQSTTETFSFDYVFDNHASQAEVYAEVEPLVNSAIDGYRVCLFAYGQTGSGKTYTMEGSLASESTYGIIPRALATVFARQEALAKEGWSYTLTCSMVEIYNDAIRDLQQNPRLYEGANAAGNGSYHTIKHQGDDTSVTNVRSTPLTSFADFQKVYRLASQHRRTARTQINDRSSRSHCIFTLSIHGQNDAIRQRSAGTLCLVDLAGSERVNESGVQGQHFKEAVNINKSLLDLGKCIHAMRADTVVPWRNCKLTYMLQNYLGAKGGKMLMIVSISDKREHLPESVNSLRFATRVSETVVGQSIKRVTSY